MCSWVQKFLANSLRTLTANHAKYTKRIRVFRVVRGQKICPPTQPALTPNEKREPREAAASDSWMPSEPTGCLPLAPRSGSAHGSSLLSPVQINDRCNDENEGENTRPALCVKARKKQPAEN